MSSYEEISRRTPAWLKTLYRRFWMLGRPYRLTIKRFGHFDVAYREGSADIGLIKHAFNHDFFSPRFRSTRPGRITSSLI